MKKCIQKITLEYLILFIFGGSIYFLTEIAFRGYSHYSMFILGGICMILIGLINEIYGWNLYIEFQVLIGLVCVLVLEFLSGCILNLWLKLNIWDYSNMPFNILGQICLPFAIIWIPLIILAIILDDYIRYLVFKEEYPRYKSILLEKFKKKK